MLLAKSDKESKALSSYRNFMTMSSLAARFDKSSFTGTVLLAKKLGDRVAEPVGSLGFSRFFVSFFIDWKKEKPFRLEEIMSFVLKSATATNTVYNQ